MKKEKNIVLKISVILDLIQDLQRLSLPLYMRNGMRGRFQIKFGITPLFSNGGFTLIELLVIVLIVGILASVAVPQYQKAVDKARVTELLTLTKHVKTMQEVYYLENGQYATNCEELGIDAPDGYELNEINQLVNIQKGFRLDCERGVYDSNNHARAAGLFVTDGETLSLEYGLSLSEREWARDRIWCYATGTRTKTVCKALCGTDLTGDNGKSCFIK